jgi:serine protease Do
VTLGELPGSDATPATSNARSEKARWGLALVNPTSQQRQQLQLGDHAGALIAQIQPESPADEAGLRPGDLITSVQGKDVHNAQEAQNTLASATSPVRVRILREGHGLFVALTAEP